MKPGETDHVAERWGDAAFTHQLSQIDWMASPAVLLHLNERATGNPAQDWLSGWARRYFIAPRSAGPAAETAAFLGTGVLRVLVIGCGEGWLERAMAAWPEVVQIDAVDLAEAAVSRAREESERLGLTKISYRVADLNREPLPAATYDVVVAHAVLHHVSNLEHLLPQIDGALKSDGVLIVNEYVGPARFQFSDEVIEIINELFDCLPSRLRHSLLQQRTYERKERPDRDTVITNDPSEAVRSDELRTQIHDRFHVFDERNIGGTILQHLLYDAVQNFRFEDSRERAMIELCCQIEAMLVDGGVVPSNFVILAARRKGAGPHIPRAVPAPTLTADLFDDDPLGFGRPQWSAAALRGASNTAAEGGGAPPSLKLSPRMLKILRTALLSTRPQRRMLVRRSRVLEAIEQFRYATARKVSPFEWIRGRHAALAGDGDEDDRAVARLLEAFERLARRVR